MMLYRLSHNLGFLLHKTGFILDLKLRWLPKSGSPGCGNLQHVRLGIDARRLEYPCRLLCSCVVWRVAVMI